MCTVKVHQGAFLEVFHLLQQTIPHLNSSIAEFLELLSECPTLSTDESLRDLQHSLLLLFCLAFVMEDRFVPEAELFNAIEGFLQSVQSQGDCPPTFVLRAVLYLLSVCQDTCQELDWALLQTIKVAMDSAPDLHLLYFHHPLFLKFFLRYPQLMESYGHWILELWLSNEDYTSIDEVNISCEFEEPLNSALISPGSLDHFLQMLTNNSHAIQILVGLPAHGGRGKEAPRALSANPGKEGPVRSTPTTRTFSAVMKYKQPPSQSPPLSPPSPTKAKKPTATPKRVNPMAGATPVMAAIRPLRTGGAKKAANVPGKSLLLVHHLHAYALPPLPPLSPSTAGDGDGLSLWVSGAEFEFDGGGMVTTRSLFHYHCPAVAHPPLPIHGRSGPLHSPEPCYHPAHSCHQHHPSMWSMPTSRT